MSATFMRQRLRCTAPLALSLLFSTATPAAGNPDHFAVADAQIKALGIQTIALQAGGDALQRRFPARVLVPPQAEQVISSPLAGMVSQLLVEANQAVRTGAPLLKIASPEFGALQLQLLQAQSRATLARQTALREKQLADEGIIAGRRQLEAEAARSEADAALKQAKAALRLSGMTPTAIERLITSGDPLDELTLSAVAAGVITQMEAHSGERVAAATPLLHIVRTDKLLLDIQVPAGDSAAWAPGTAVKIQGRRASARLLSSAAIVSADNQSLSLRAAVDDAADVRPGEVLSVELPATTMRSGWDLPLAAIARDGDRAVVFVRSADGFEARTVTLLASAAERVQVQGRLSAGDVVATSGIVALKGAWLVGDEEEAP